MKQITKVLFLNFTFCYQFQFQGDLYVSITRVIIHLLIHEPQNWKKTPIMTYSCIITSLYAIPFETGLICFLPLCWVSTLIKGKALREIRPWKHSLNMSSNLPRMQKRNVKNKQEEQTNLFKIRFFMYEYVCVCVSGGIST